MYEAAVAQQAQQQQLGQFNQTDPPPYPEPSEGSSTGSSKSGTGTSGSMSFTMEPPSAVIAPSTGTWWHLLRPRRNLIGRYGVPGVEAWVLITGRTEIQR